MRLKFAFSFLVLATAAILISCNGTDNPANSNSRKPAGPDVTYADGARRVTIEELDAMIKNGEAYIVDVRNQASYDIGHIPGSRLIPAGEIANHLSELPRDKTIVTYCS
jgi:3-mercaptopyruvate sulfurtransferase SseA